MTAQPAPTDPRQLPAAAPDQSYWLHVDDQGREWRLARAWPRHSIFVRVSDGGTEETVTYAQRTNDGVKVPIPRGQDWREVWPTEEPKVDGSLVMWSRRRA